MMMEQSISLWKSSCDKKERQTQPLWKGGCNYSFDTFENCFESEILSFTDPPQMKRNWAIQLNESTASSLLFRSSWKPPSVCYSLFGRVIVLSKKKGRKNVLPSRRWSHVRAPPLKAGTLTRWALALARRLNCITATYRNLGTYCTHVITKGCRDIFHKRTIFFQNVIGRRDLPQHLVRWAARCLTS